MWLNWILFVCFTVLAFAAIFFAVVGKYELAFFWLGFLIHMKLWDIEGEIRKLNNCNK